MDANPTLTAELFQLPVFESEWVLWLLVGLSALSISIILERWVFFLRRSIDLRSVHTRLRDHLDEEEFDGAFSFLGRFDTYETNVVREGLLEHGKGVDAVEEAMAGAEEMERLRFSRGLGFLATVGSNAPFIGLFGTVLGIIRAFQDLSLDMSQASNSVMTGISEALVATAVGLLVAIPAVIAFNAFNGRLAARQAQTRLLTSAVLVTLKKGRS